VSCSIVVDVDVFPCLGQRRFRAIWQGGPGCKSTPLKSKRRGEAKTALDEKLGKAVKPWTLHHLRRTAATRMADLGVQPHVIEAVLNHISGHKAGVAGIYNRSTYVAEKRAALDLWAVHIEIIVAKAKGANVTRLKRA
jgi:integrase